jgi:hypothetical protein
LFVQVIHHGLFAVLPGLTGGSKIQNQSLNGVVEVLSSAASLRFRADFDFHRHSSFGVQMIALHFSHSTSLLVRSIFLSRLAWAWRRHLKRRSRPRGSQVGQAWRAEQVQDLAVTTYRSDRPDHRH